MARKTISINEEIYKRITRTGVWGETMDDILGRIMDVYEKTMMSSAISKPSEK